MLWQRTATRITARSRSREVRGPPSSQLRTVRYPHLQYTVVPVASCIGHEDQLCTKIKYGRLPEWPKGAVCKTAGIAYVGSNPTPATSWMGGSCSRKARTGSTSSFLLVASLLTVEGLRHPQTPLGWSRVGVRLAPRRLRHRPQAPFRRAWGPGQNISGPGVRIPLGSNFFFQAWNCGHTDP